MNNIQHTIIMAIEELPDDNEGYVSITKIASKVKVDSTKIQQALNFLYENGYVSSVKNTKYQLTQKGLFYTWVFEPIDNRLNYHTSIVSSQLSWLLGLTAILILLVVILLFKV